MELLNLLDINRYVLKSLGRSGRSKAVLAAAKNWNTYNRFIESRIDHIKTNDLFNGYIQIWREGYMATGEHGTACFCGLYKAESFDDAMVMYDEDMNRIYPNEKDRAPKYKNDRGNWISWGCRFYDNEADARKGFG